MAPKPVSACCPLCEEWYQAPLEFNLMRDSKWGRVHTQLLELEGWVRSKDDKDDVRTQILGRLDEVRREEQ